MSSQWKQAKNLRQHESGFSLLSAMMGVGIAGISIAAMTSSFSGAFKAEDSLKANADLEDMKRSVRLTLSRKMLCDRSGLIGLTIDPGNPSATTVVINSPATGAAYLKEGEKIPRTNWSINSLRFTSLTQAGTDTYLAALSLDGTYRAGGGPSSTLRKDRNNASQLLPAEFSTILKLDAANKILSCGDTDSGSCPRKQSIYTALCVVSRYLPYNDSRHAPFGNVPLSGVTLPPFSCAPGQDLCVQVWGPTPQVCESFCNVGGTNCAWYTLSPSVQLCTSEVLPRCSSDWWKEVASRKCTME